jgi:hypothetical protein
MKPGHSLFYGTTYLNGIASVGRASYTVLVAVIITMKQTSKEN